MKNFITIILVAFVLLMTACSPVTVPPAHKGKFLTPSGYQPEILPSGKYWEGFRETLVLIETNTDTYKESVVVVLKDKLSIQVDIRFQGRINGNDQVVNAMFNDIVAGSDNLVGFEEVYKVYGQMQVRNKTREVVSQYNVDEVHKNYARLSVEIAKSLEKALQATPLQISNVALGNIAYPKVVNDAINAAEERRLAIAKEEAQAEIEMTKKRNEQRLAEADYQVKMTRARTVRDENKTLAEGITPELLELKRLEVSQTLAEKADKGTVYVPVDFGNTSGVSNRIFSKDK